MINKETVVLNRVTEGADFIGDLGPVLESSIKSNISVMTALIEELDRSWVAVVIDPSPTALNCLHALEDLSVYVNLLRSDNKVTSVET